MNHRQKHSPLIVRSRAWRQALERLDEALDKNALSSNAEKIAAMRAAYFADVDAMEPVIIPKRNKRNVAADVSPIWPTKTQNSKLNT
jgi:hypothetical protein